jgi:hypothetical protein
MKETMKLESKNNNNPLNYKLQIFKHPFPNINYTSTNGFKKLLNP